jgi:hypothetical protein
MIKQPGKVPASTWGPGSPVLQGDPECHVSYSMYRGPCPTPQDVFLLLWSQSVMGSFAGHGSNVRYEFIITSTRHVFRASWPSSVVRRLYFIKLPAILEYFLPKFLRVQNLGIEPRTPWSQVGAATSELTQLVCLGSCGTGSQLNLQQL